MCLSSPDLEAPEPQLLLLLLTDCLQLFTALPESSQDVLYVLALDLLNHFQGLIDGRHLKVLGNMIGTVQHEGYKDMFEKKLRKLTGELNGADGRGGDTDEVDGI